MHRQHTVEITDVPAEIIFDFAACICNNQAYVSGVGTSNKETWRWDTVGGWVRCGDMVQGRVEHGLTFVGSTSMFTIGGFVEATETTLSSVEEFDTVRNTWHTAGQLTHCARRAGRVSHNTLVYMFGGVTRHKWANNDVDLNYIQVFDVTTKQCSVLTQRLPLPERLLQAVLWDKSVILMNESLDVALPSFRGMEKDGGHKIIGG